jgi:hypothetical protein
MQTDKNSHRGAVLDRETAQLRFVHCPKKRKSGPRVREDVLLRITGGPETWFSGESFGGCAWIMGICRVQKTKHLIHQNPFGSLKSHR